MAGLDKPLDVGLVNEFRTLAQDIFTRHGATHGTESGGATIIRGEGGIPTLWIRGEEIGFDNYNPLDGGEEIDLQSSGPGRCSVQNEDDLRRAITVLHDLDKALSSSSGNSGEFAAFPSIVIPPNAIIEPIAEHPATSAIRDILIRGWIPTFEPGISVPVRQYDKHISRVLELLQLENPEAELRQFLQSALPENDSGVAIVAAALVALPYPIGAYRQALTDWETNCGIEERNAWIRENVPEKERSFLANGQNRLDAVSIFTKAIREQMDLTAQELGFSAPVLVDGKMLIVGVVSPETAAKLLKKTSANCRAPNPLQIDVHRRALESGGWTLTADPIIISKNGVLMDGVQRLSAVVLYGKPVLMTIEFSVESL